MAREVYPLLINLLVSKKIEVGCSYVDFDAREMLFCPRWNLLPSNDSLLLSPPDEHVIDQTPPFPNPTFNFSHSLPRI